MLRGSRDFASREAYAAFLRRAVRAAQRGPTAAFGGGSGRAAVAAGDSGWRRATACRCEWTAGSTIHVGGQHLLGDQPADRRAGRGAAVRRACRGVVRPEAGGSACRGCGAAASTASSTGTSSTGWCASRGRSPTIATATDLFPASRFRMAYDRLVEQQPERAAKEYLRILHLAARESEAGVEAALAQSARRGRAVECRRRWKRAACSSDRAVVGDRGASSAPVDLATVRRLTGRQGGRRWRSERNVKESAGRRT